MIFTSLIGRKSRRELWNLLQKEKSEETRKEKDLTNTDVACFCFLFVSSTANEFIQDRAWNERGRLSTSWLGIERKQWWKTHSIGQAKICTTSTDVATRGVIRWRSKANHSQVKIWLSLVRFGEIRFLSRRRNASSAVHFQESQPVG